MSSGENPEIIEIGSFDGKDFKPCPGQNNLRVKPIRIIQLVLSTILLGLTIGLTQDMVLDFGNLSLLGIINFSFFIIEIVDVLSQFGNDPIPDTPMFVFGSSGLVLYLITSGGSFAIFANRKKSSGLLVAIGVFSFLAALVHLMDATLIFIFGLGEPKRVPYSNLETVLFMKNRKSNCRVKMMRPNCGFGSICASPIVGTCDDPYVVPMAKPIRIFQFLLVTTLFGVTIYTISKNSPYQQVEGALLTVLFGSFLFITLVDIISQFGGDPIPDTPMFLFGVVGILLFVIATVDIYFAARKEKIEEVWRLNLSMSLSATASFLFLFDVIMIFLYGY